MAGRPGARFRVAGAAYVQEDGGLVDLGTDPLLRSLRGDPRRAALLRRLITQLTALATTLLACAPAPSEGAGARDSG